MIGSEQIERAEKTLAVVYMGSTDRQLEMLQVDRETFDTFIQSRLGAVKHRYRELWSDVDPRIEPALNTVIAHAFLVGLIVGRNQAVGPA